MISVFPRELNKIGEANVGRYSMHCPAMNDSSRYIKSVPSRPTSTVKKSASAVLLFRHELNA